MQKTWRASDIFIVLLIVGLGGLMLLQMTQGDRLHTRINTAVDNTESLRSTQDEVLLRLGSLERKVASIRSGAVTIDGGTGDGGGSQEFSEEEKRGDILIQHSPMRIKTLNPVTYSDYYASVILGYLFDAMIERDRDTLEWKPRMAESWEISDDKLTFTFKLREGLRWSDGKPITAHDVVFSYETMMNPAVDAARIATYYTDVESVKALDDLTVQFKYKRPYFLSFSFAGGITIVPRHAMAFSDPKDFNRIRDPKVFSGPYVIESWKPGQEIVLRRNSRYNNKPYYFDKVVFRIVEDESAAFQMLKAGKIDFLRLEPEQYRQMKDDAELMSNYRRLKYYAPGRGYIYIGWNNRSPLFKDARVRTAMTLLVPRERMKHDIFEDNAIIVTGPFWPGTGELDLPLQYDKSIEALPFDPVRAVKLLNEAGWRDTNNDGILDKDGAPLRFQIVLAANKPVRRDIAAITAEEMGKVGIKAELHQFEWTVFEDKLKKRDFDACLLGWSGTLEGDPYQIWHSTSAEREGSNHIGFNNPEADRLIEAARQELDTEKRNKLYHEFHALLHREQPYTFLFSQPWFTAVHKRFQGVKVHPLGLYDDEWWTRPEDRRRPDQAQD